MKKLKADLFVGQNMNNFINHSDKLQIILCVFPEKYRATETFVCNGVKYINTQYH